MTSEERFKVGQIVRLKSGGPEMTVKKQEAFLDGDYRCQWFAGRKLEFGDFPHDSLELVKPNDE
jgi:uncharacterized protein YodC (DUF2158 family)